MAGNDQRRLSVTVTGDSKAAQAALFALGRRVKAAGNDVEALKRKLDELSAKNPNVDVDVDDGAAQTKLQAFMAKLRRINGSTAKANVKADTKRAEAGFSSLTRKLIGLGVSLKALKWGSVLIGLTSLLGPASHLVANLAPLAGLLVALPGTLIGAAGALGVLKIAFSGVGNAISAGLQGDTKKFNKEMKQLSPNARAVASTIVGLRGALNGLRHAVQDRFFAGMAHDLKQLASRALPVLRDNLVGIAGAFNRIGRNAIQAVGRTKVLANLSGTLDSFRAGLSRAAGAVAPIVRALTTLGAVGSQLFPRMGSAITVAAKAFNRFIQHAAKTGQLTQWLNAGVRVLKLLAKLAYNVGSILISVFSAAGKTGGNFLSTLVRVTGQIAEFLNTKQGIAALNTVFKSLAIISGGVGKALAAVLPAIVGLLKGLAPAIGPLTTALLGVVRAVTPLLPSLGQLAGVIAQALAGAIGHVLVPVLSAVAGMLSVVAGFLARHKTLTYVLVAAILAWAAAQWILNAAMDANPIGAIILAVIALATVAYVVYKHWNTIAKFFIWLWNTAFRGPALAVAHWFTGPFVGFFKRIGNWFTGPFLGFFKRIGHWFSGPFSGFFKRVGHWFSGPFVGFFKRVGHWFTGPFVGFFKRVGHWFSGPFVGFFKRVGHWFSGPFAGFFKSVGRWFSGTFAGFFRRVGRWFTGPFLGFFKRVGRWFTGTFLGFFKRLGHWYISTYVGFFRRAAHWFTGPFLGFFKRVGHWFSGPFVNFFKRVGHWFTGPFSGFFKRVGHWFSGPFVNFFKRAGSRVGNFMHGAANKAKSAWNGLKGGLSKVWNGIKSAVFTPLNNYLAKRIPGWHGSMKTKALAYWRAVQRGVRILWQRIVNNVIMPIRNFFTKRIPAWTGTLVGKVKALWGGMTGRLKTLWHQIQNNVITPIKNFFVKRIPSWTGTLVGKIKSLWGNMVGRVKQLWNSWKNNVLWPIHVFWTKRIPQWTGTLVGRVKQLWNGMVNRIKTLWHQIQNNVLTPIRVFWTKRVPSWTGTLVGRVKSLWGGMVSRIKSLWQGLLKNVINPIKNFFTKKIPAWSGTLVGAVKKNFNNLASSVRRIWIRIKNFVKGPVKGMLGMVANLLDAVGKIADKFNIPKVPGMAKAAAGAVRNFRDRVNGFKSGGPIKGPGSGTSDSILARLSNGEFVINAQSVNAVGANTLAYINKYGELPQFVRGGAWYIPDMITKIARHLQNGVSMSSGFRGGSRSLSGNLDYHSRGMAADLIASPGQGARDALARKFYTPAVRSYLLEEIHTRANGRTGWYVKNGRAVGPSFYGSEVPGHRDHVHIAMTRRSVNELWDQVSSNKGGILGKIKSFAGSLLSGASEIFDWISDFYNKYFKKYVDQITNIGKGDKNGILGDVVSGIGKKAVDGVMDWAQNKFSSILSAIGGGGQGYAKGIPTHGTLANWIREAMRLTHVDGRPGWFAKLYSIAMRESRGNPRAVNDYDINAKIGDPTKGVMQIRSSYIRKFHQPGTSYNLFDPIANIAAAINYIKYRYKTPFNTPANYYAEGTEHARRGLAWVGENGPELVNFRGGESVTPAGEIGTTVVIESITIVTQATDAKTLVRELRPALVRELRNNGINPGALGGRK